jgi:hypothetical protein
LGDRNVLGLVLGFIFIILVGTLTIILRKRYPLKYFKENDEAKDVNCKEVSLVGGVDMVAKKKKRKCDKKACILRIMKILNSDYGLIEFENQHQFEHYDFTEDYQFYNPITKQLAAKSYKKIFESNHSSIIIFQGKMQKKVENRKKMKQMKEELEEKQHV